jgi:two-component system, sporulation sensor kinase E
MPKQVPFIHKLLGKIDRLDRESIQNYITGLADDTAVYQQILNHLNDGVLLVAPDATLLYANQQAQHWIGTAFKSGKPLRLSQILKDRELADFILGHIPATSERAVANLSILTPREMTLRVTVLPLIPDDKKVTLIVLTQVPPSENSQDPKTDKFQALISLAAGIAHEIGNPLNAIAIHLELLKKEVAALADPKKKHLEKALNVLNAETARLDRIVRNFLKATRKPPLRYKLENLNRILEDAAGFMNPELEENKVRLDLNLDPRIPVFLLDRERLYQAFINLIKNAMESMPRGGGLKISSAYEAPVVMIRFKDEGSGIKESDMPHIFEAYYTTKEEGSGLGLMTVYNAVKEHGGRIEVTSKPGKGSAFVIYLPVRKPNLQLPQYKAKT